MRRWVPVLAIAVLPTLESCVGDDPSTAGDTSAADSGVDATTSDASNDSSAPGDSGVDAALPDPCKGEGSGCPNLVDPSHLQLWLRADTQVDCAGGRVTTWHDLSGHGRDATAATYPDGGPAASPQCGIDKMNGHDVISFTRPTETQQPILAETMVVDLGFLAHSSFTMMIMQKPTFSASATIMGLLSADRTANGTPSCGGGTDQSNNGALDFAIGALPDGGSVSATFDNDAICRLFSTPLFLPLAYSATSLFDTASGHTILLGGSDVFRGDGGVNDLMQVADLNLRPGAIGRDSNADKDERYVGDIAEIVVYDVALGGELNGLSAYLNARWAP